MRTDDIFINIQNYSSIIQCNYFAAIKLRFAVIPLSLVSYVTFSLLFDEVVGF
jgi:hypothetical protein